jgi:hypothetical protein
LEVRIVFEFEEEQIDHEMQRLTKKILRWRPDFDPAEIEDLEFVDQEIVLNVFFPAHRSTLSRAIRAGVFPPPVAKSAGKNLWSLRVIAVWRLRIDAVSLSKCVVGG